MATRFEPAQYAAPVRALLGDLRLMPLDEGQPNRAALDQLSALDEVLLFDGQPVRHRELARCRRAVALSRLPRRSAPDRPVPSRPRRQLLARDPAPARRRLCQRQVLVSPGRPASVHEALNLSARALARDMDADLHPIGQGAAGTRARSPICARRPAWPGAPPWRCAARSRSASGSSCSTTAIGAPAVPPDASASDCVVLHQARVKQPGAAVNSASGSPAPSPAKA